MSGLTFLITVLEFNYLLTQLMNGVVLGMTLVLISLGLSIIFGMMGIINFAHGDILLVGIYVAWSVDKAVNNIVVGIIMGGIATAVLGMLIERLTLRTTYEYGPLMQLLLTFGIAEILRGGVKIVWGNTGKSFSVPAWGSGNVDLVIFSYPIYRLIVVFVSAGLVVATYLLLTRTDIGLIIRAGTQNRDMVDALGIDVFKMFLIVFALGTALAGIAGGLIGPIYGVNPNVGIELLIPAFVVVIVGGVGSFRGTIIAGLLIGELMVLTGLVYSQASSIIIFLFMAIVLLLRPRGLFGERGVMG